MTTLYARPETKLGRSLTAKLMGDPDPNRQAKSDALKARVKKDTNQGWHWGLRSSPRKAG